MKRLFISVFCMFSATISFSAEKFISYAPSIESFALAQNGQVINLLCDSLEDEGIQMAINNLQNDFQSVTGNKPTLQSTATCSSCIIIGSLKSSFIKKLMATGKINKKSLVGKHEKYIIQLVDNPMKGGKKSSNYSGQ